MLDYEIIARRRAVFSFRLPVFSRESRFNFSVFSYVNSQPKTVNYLLARLLSCPIYNRHVKVKKQTESSRDIMDKEKDTTINNNVVKGQISPAQKSRVFSVGINSVDNQRDLEEMNKKKAVFLKAEKLAMATYMVTSFIPDEDPIKNKIKEATIDFLSDAHAFSNVMFQNETEHRRKAIFTLQEITVFLSLASSNNLVSGMNYSILSREYDNLRNLLESVDNVKILKEDNASLSEDFFIKEREALFVREPWVSDNNKGQNLIKDKSPTLLSFMKKAETRGEINRINTPKKTEQKPKNDRRDNILKILRKKGEITIKDISTTISGCSEKTLQRELLALVQNGVLKKEGEKRWSRYSLAQ